jgi:hypothetical protein
MAGNIHIHPAPGLGDLMPGWWDYPNDPAALASQGITKTPGINEILPAVWTIPENPLKAYVTGQTKMIGQGGGSKQRSGNVSAKGAKGVGDIVPTGPFPVPNNQFKGFTAPGASAPPQINGQGVGGLGCGGGCGCDDCGGGLSGLGQTAPAGTASDFSNSLSNIGQDLTNGDWTMLASDVGTFLSLPVVFGIPLWLFGIGGFFAIDMLMSHKVGVSKR